MFIITIAVRKKKIEFTTIINKNLNIIEKIFDFLFRNIVNFSNKIILFNIVIYRYLICEIVLFFVNTNVHKNSIKNNYRIEHILIV